MSLVRLIQNLLIDQSDQSFFTHLDQDRYALNVFDPKANKYCPSKALSKVINFASGFGLFIFWIFSEISLSYIAPVPCAMG